MAFRDDLVLTTPPPDGELGILKALICERCQLQLDAFVDRHQSPANGTYAKCPDCGGQMGIDWSASNILVKSRGPGVSSTSYGMRRAKELRDRNQKLAKTQWDNIQPIQPREGLVARNPTQDGPLDPNGRMGKKKKKPTIYLG